MSVAQRIFKFLAARFHIPGDALDYFFASGRLDRGAETTLPFPAELVPLGARLALRGWMNNKFFPSNRDWILPFWAERQFDPRDPAFIPRGFNLYTINYTHRDWTMIGNLAREREAIVDPRGLVTPWFDGWSLDVWLETDGALIVPSRLPAAQVEQSLYENLPVVVTEFRAMNLRVRTEVFGAEQSDGREYVIEQIKVENPTSAPRGAMLYLSVRPFNPEGVSLVKTIEFRPCHSPGTARQGRCERSSKTLGVANGEKSRSQTSETLRSAQGDNCVAIFVNGALGARLPVPDAIACSNFADSDVALALPALNGKPRVMCEAGLATGLAAYRLELAPGEGKTLSVQMPIQPEPRDEDDPMPLPQIAPANELRRATVSVWREKLTRGMRVQLPDEKLQSAFDANKAFLLLLHDGESITPGPFTYHQFWFRDAAYMLNALDKLGYHDESRSVLERFARRLQKDGYLRATEGEWDSNGAAIWAMVENARLTGDKNLLSGNYWSLLRMASWINSKRQETKDQRRKTERSPHRGLLPPGPSAEHLGPNDYFYWDDFWGLAGLRDAAQTAEWLGQTGDAKKLRANFDSFRVDIDSSLAAAAARLGRAAMPASPYRRLDAAMIGNLAALYPLRLFEPNDPRIADTITALKQFAWMEDAYFNHVGHSAFGTYLTLHVAQCLLFQRNADAWNIIQWVLRHASPTFTWAEGIHPITRGGAMGDGHHGWALADFLLAVRNALLFEESDHLVITPALPKDWTFETSVIKVQDAPTYFGTVSYTIAFGARAGTLVVNGEWREEPAYVEWNLPFALREAGADAGSAEIIGNTVRLPRGARRVVAMW